MDKKYTFDNGPGSPPTSMLTGPNYFAYDVYQLSPPEVKELFIFFLSDYNDRIPSFPHQELCSCLQEIPE